MLVKTWLEKTVRGRLLMVIDNADDTQLFFPPSSQGGSIDTHSTAETRGGLARYIPECVSTEEASNLSIRLEHLPLALTQAAAFMQENSISISKYIRLLDESDESLRLIVSFCDQRNEEGRQSSTGKIIKALGTLKAFSFVSEAKNNSIDMHRLVQLTSSRVLGDEHPHTLTSMANLAHTWNSQERRFDAIQLMRDCLRLRQRCLGVDHPDTRFSLLDLEKWEKDLTRDKGKVVAVKKRFSFKVPIRNKRVIFKRGLYRQ
ncbi:TPR domain protein [Colletotrichum incanum]|nr:TPR domain protein [Colletotrichum incanum]